MAEGTDSIVDTKSQADKLTELLASASQQYALKSYNTASDLYAQAAELQDEINGEMNPDNAELLYVYGRCLHHLAVSKSDVLGGKVAGTGVGSGANKSAGKKRKRDGDATVESSAAVGSVAKDDADGGDIVAEKVLETVVEEKDGSIVKEEEHKTKVESKPFFQIDGDDEEWQDDDGVDGGEMDEEAADAEAEEEEDDLAIAYEILDTARILLVRQIEGLQEHEKDKGKAEDAVDEVGKQIRTIKERLADTHDLQAEISLENERFDDAIADSRQSLELKMDLYDESDGLVSEAHYKLSLALEFASVTTPKDADGNPKEGAEQEVDQKLRDEAVHEMQAAINSTKLKLEKETKAMGDLTQDALMKKQAEQRDFEEIISDMEQRVSFMHNVGLLFYLKRH